MSCRQLNAKFVVFNNYAVSLAFSKKGNCLVVDNYVFDRFARLWK